MTDDLEAPAAEAEPEAEPTEDQVTYSPRRA